MKSEYDQLIREACRKHLPHVDWRLLKAQYYQESRLYPHAKSPVGAMGIAQFMPQTWAEWAPRSGYAGWRPEHPEAAIYTGARYMQHLTEQWSWPRPDMDRHCLAMASYNAGLGNILRAQQLGGNRSMYHEIIPNLERVTGHHSRETLDYVTRILGYYNRQILQG